ncbi:MAG: Multicopper oxidase, partial [uncultured Phycisphaerae bacterium]
AYATQHHPVRRGPRGRRRIEPKPTPRARRPGRRRGRAGAERPPRQRVGRPDVRPVPARAAGLGLHAGRDARRVDAAVQGGRRREGVSPGGRAVQAGVRAGARGGLLGLQRPDPRPHDRGGRGRPRADLRDQPPARADDRPLARPAPAGGDGRRQRADPAADRARADVQVRVHAPPVRHVHVPLAFRRDDADGLGHDGHVRHPPARPGQGGRAAGPGLRADAQRVGHPPRHEPPGPERDERLQRADVQQQGVPRDLAARRAHRAAGAHPARQPRRDGPPPDPHPRLQLPRRRHGRRAHPRGRAVAGDDRARARRQHARHRVRRRRARRLGVPLPHDPPRDEPDGPRHPQPARRGRGRVRQEPPPAPARLHDDGRARHGRPRRAHAAHDRAAQQHPDEGRRGPVRLHRHGRHVHRHQGARRHRLVRRPRLVPAPRRHRRRPRHRRRTPLARPRRERGRRFNNAKQGGRRDGVHLPSSPRRLSGHAGQVPQVQDEAQADRV